MQPLLQKLLYNPKNAPSLSFNFIDGSAFSPQITFTRASTATYFDSAGVLQSAANNAPRFDYNPATLAAQGLLIEESRTNTAYPSITPAVTTGTMLIGTGIATTVANAAVAPDGTTTATSYTSVQGNSNSISGSSVRHLNGVTAAGTYTVSFFAKAVTGGFSVVVRFVDSGASLDTTVTCSATDGGNNTVTTGWRRYYATVTLGAGSTAFYSIFNFASNTDTTYIWGAQLEAGAFPTSYIPTTTTALTRASDVASVNTLSPWFNAAEGTLFAQAEVPSVVLADRTMALLGRSTSVTQDIGVSISRAPDSRRILVIVNLTGQLSYAPAGTATSSKGAVAYKTDDSQGAFDGASSPVDTSVTLPTLLTTLYLGNSDGGTAHLNGWLKRVTYYPRRLSQAELEAITA